jgi:hypothetical protein
MNTGLPGQRGAAGFGSERNREAWDRLHSTALLLIVAIDQRGAAAQVRVGPALSRTTSHGSRQSHGIEPGKPPYSVREGGSRICFVRDPDEYRIEIIERD